MQNRDFQNTRAAPMDNQGMQNPASNIAGMPQNNMNGPGDPPPPPPNNYMRGPPPPPPNNYMGRPPPPNNYMGGPPPPPPPNNYGGGPQNMGGMPQNNFGGMPTSNMGGVPQGPGWTNNMPGNMQQNFPTGPNNGGMPHQGAPSDYQNNYS